ncbi:hypothetical protein BDQ17DRAFT_733085 [Cyathus striatus]|nr:hypothetical protein BDQ17DRAFT_733085 [Cyathus striatus]
MNMLFCSYLQAYSVRHRLLRCANETAMFDTDKRASHVSGASSVVWAGTKCARATEPRRRYDELRLSCNKENSSLPTSFPVSYLMHEGFSILLAPTLIISYSWWSGFAVISPLRHQIVKHPLLVVLWLNLFEDSSCSDDSGGNLPSQIFRYAVVCIARSLFFFISCARRQSHI